MQLEIRLTQPAYLRRSQETTWEHSVLVSVVPVHSAENLCPPLMPYLLSIAQTVIRNA